jgi:hypothetical protein
VEIRYTISKTGEGSNEKENSLEDKSGAEPADRDEAGEVEEYEVVKEEVGRVDNSCSHLSGPRK